MRNHPAEVIDPKNLCTVYISPRIRAHKTFHLLFDHLDKLPHHVITESVREWDYGEYEGLLSSEILAKNPGWTIWKNGCPGGESTEEMCFRVDEVIAKVSQCFSPYAAWSDCRHCRSGRSINNGSRTVKALETSSLSLTAISVVSSFRAGSASRSLLVGRSKHRLFHEANVARS